MFRRRQPGEPMKAHRGRVWRDGDLWRYSCNDCDYGAGTRPGGFAHEVALPWLVGLATDHARVKPFAHKDAT